ncbi:MAG: thymidylate synthase [Chelatococcus sp.]|nr:MAG: thymidylate synthase [Chelatococcus sp.]
MQPTATIIEDSISPDGIRLTTIQLRYWRPIHSEFMTHRVFGRNARSSRAVPVMALLREPIVEPLHYGMNRPGMQAVEKMTGLRLFAARMIWRGMARMTRLGVRGLVALGGHKQWANRPLEWFGCIDVLATATDFANFYGLRLDGGAQPEMRALAEAMKAAMDQSRPKVLLPGQWHLPYVTSEERATLSLADQRKLSTARCARLTYKPFDGAGDIASETARHDRLVVSRPVHASPAEHQATPDIAIVDQPGSDRVWEKPQLHGNLRGWCQYRKMLPNEAIEEPRLAA